MVNTLLDTNMYAVENHIQFMSHHNQEAGHRAGWADGHDQLSRFRSAAGAVNFAAVLMHVVSMQTSDFLHCLGDYYHSEVHLESAYCASVHVALCCK